MAYQIGSQLKINITITNDVPVSTYELTIDTQIVYSGSNSIITIDTSLMTEGQHDIIIRAQATCGLWSSPIKKSINLVSCLNPTCGFIVTQS